MDSGIAVRIVSVVIGKMIESHRRQKRLLLWSELAVIVAVLVFAIVHLWFGLPLL
jgi:hypothetical protein